MNTKNNPLIARCVRCGHRGDWHLIPVGGTPDHFATVDTICKYPECGGKGLACKGYILPADGPYNAIGEELHQFGTPLVQGLGFRESYPDHATARLVADALNRNYGPSWAEDGNRG